jgi:hypothetical protein
MYPLRMTRSLAVAVGVALLAVPSAASAASLTVSPQKPCYGSGEKVNLLGTGFTPTTDPSDTSDHVQVTRAGRTVGTLGTDAFGAFNGELTLGLDSGRQTRTYTATDLVDPTISASIQILVSAVRVGLKPASGPPGRILSITARGFTTGRTLWVHVVRGKSRRNIKLGFLKGACHGLKTRKRLLPRNAPVGVYRLQFDTFRRYDGRAEKRPVRDVYTITVTRF